MATHLRTSSSAERTRLRQPSGVFLPIQLLTLALSCVVGAIVLLVFRGWSGGLLAIMGGALASAAAKQI